MCSKVDCGGSGRRGCQAGRSIKQPDEDDDRDRHAKCPQENAAHCGQASIVRQVEVNAVTRGGFPRGQSGPAIRLTDRLQDFFGMSRHADLAPYPLDAALR